MNLDIIMLRCIAVFIATVAHELTRAIVSISLGDNLPKKEGRLSLNPFKYFEPIGFILGVMTGFGWGKIVETSSLYYKDRKKGRLLVSILPSVTNLILAIIFFICVGFVATETLAYLFYTCGYINICILVYNLLPVTPMDCVNVLSVTLPSNKYYSLMQNEKLIQMIFLILLFFGITDFIIQPVIDTIVKLILIPIEIIF